jgi:hypothetical protein
MTDTLTLHENGMAEGTLAPRMLLPLAEHGTDEHRVQTSRWVLECGVFPPDSQIHKQAQKVIAAYLAGKTLPKA